MPRKRKSNKELPQRVYKKHGAFYLVTQENKWIRLGATKTEMYKALSELYIKPPASYTIESLWNDFFQDHAVKLSQATQRGYQKSAKQLLKPFGHMLPGEIESPDIARYLLIRGKKAATNANQEIGLLSSMYTYAVGLGITNRNPCLRVKRHKLRPRDRYIENRELDAFRSVCNDFMLCYVDLKYITGLRQTDMLLLTMNNIRDEGLYIKPNKTKNSTGEARLFIWTPELKEVIERINQLKRPKFTDHFFVKSNGKPFIDENLEVKNFSYWWSKIMKKALKETSLTISFQEKDIRAKTATDADDDGQNATEILGHEDSRTTRIYLRGKQIKRVMPFVKKG